MASQSLEYVRASTRELHSKASAGLNAVKNAAKMGGFYRTPVLSEEPKNKVVPVAKTVHALLELERGIRQHFLTVQEAGDEDAAISAATKMKKAAEAIGAASLEKILKDDVNTGFVLLMWKAGFNTELLEQINGFFADFPSPGMEVAARAHDGGGCNFRLKGKDEIRIGEMRPRKAQVSVDNIISFKPSKFDFPIVSTDYSSNDGAFTINQANLLIHIADSCARKTKKDPIAHVIRMLGEAGFDVGEVLWRMQDHLTTLQGGEGLLAKPHQYEFSMKLVQGPLPEMSDFLQTSAGESRLPTRLVTRASMNFAEEGKPHVRLSLILPDAWLVLNSEIGGQRIDIVHYLSEFKK